MEFKVVRLTEKFYSEYPAELFPEILQKKSRAYTCLMLGISPDKFICIPYRSEISHQYAYIFKKSMRSKSHRSGLDYTKLVVVLGREYLSDDGIVDNDEYSETAKNIDTIARDVKKFISDYIKYTGGTREISPREFERRYRFSSLKYFVGLLPDIEK